MKKKRICMITNIGPHYRYPIFSLMGEQLGCHFFLGDRIREALHVFPYDRLKGFRLTLRNRYGGKFFWQQGVGHALRPSYDCYILDGEPYNVSSWVVLLVAKVLHKQTIGWTHGWYGRETRIKRWVKRCYFALHSHLLVYSERAIKLMQAEGIAPHKMSCIANSLDSDRLKAIRATLNPTTVYSSHFHNTLPTLIYCGRVQRSKRIDLLLEAVRNLREEGMPLNVVIVGPEIDKEDLVHGVAEAGLTDYVWLYGPCYDDNTLASLYYNAHACVSPGGVGLTVIHALSFGCPVITHDNLAEQGPEAEAITENLTGSLFEQGNIDDLKVCIRKWVTVDEEKRRHTREAAYREIDSKWNVHYQLRMLNKAIYG